MFRILFICHGNICRSPMAEFVFKDMVLKAGVADRFEIASRATSREEIGNDVYPPAKRLLSLKGIACAGHRATQITREDAEYYDFLILMDGNNSRNFHRLFGTAFDDKLSLLLSWAGENRSIADPWYSGNFEETWNDVNLGCKALLEKLIPIKQ